MDILYMFALYREVEGKTSHQTSHCERQGLQVFSEQASETIVSCVDCKHVWGQIQDMLFDQDYWKFTTQFPWL